MFTGLSVATVVIVIIAIVVVSVIYIYNKLVRSKVRTEEAWSDIDVQLKRRYDLIPNLVETVKGFAKHERETLEETLEARAKATSVNIDASNISKADMEAYASAESGVSSALGRLMAIAENYPDLKANENFLELQKELSDTENKIQAARRFYNSMVSHFSTLKQVFPSNVIANMFGFSDIEFFELPQESVEREPVAVSFE